MFSRGLLVKFVFFVCGASSLFLAVDILRCSPSHDRDSGHPAWFRPILPTQIGVLMMPGLPSYQKKMEFQSFFFLFVFSGFFFFLVFFF